MTRAELEALRDTLLALTPGELSQFSSTLRNSVPISIFAQLSPTSTNPSKTVPRDFERIVSLSVTGPDGAAALTKWIELARKALGAVKAQHAQHRGRAMEAPGRDRAIAAFVPEKTKLDAKDDLVRIGWLDKGRLAAAAVAYIEVTKKLDGLSGPTEGGTAFLIDPQHVMTAFHVVEQRDVETEGNAEQVDLEEQVAGARLSFDYTLELNKASFVTFDSLVAHDPVLDYAILKLKQPVDIPPLTFFTGPLKDPDEGFTFVANIVQHPEKLPKQLGLRNNAVWKLETDHLYYFTDTRGGTSGAPVFDDEWRVIAMHTGWESFSREEPIYMGRNLGFANRGTLARTLVPQLRAHAKTLALAVRSLP